MFAVAGITIMVSSVTFFTASPIAATSRSDYTDAGTHFLDYSNGWGDANKATAADVSSLLHAGVRFGYANYWISYVLDFISNGRISVSPLLCPRVQYPPLYQIVHSSSQPAWLFVPTADLELATQQFGTTDVELGFESEQTFLSDVTRQRIPFRIGLSRARRNAECNSSGPASPLATRVTLAP
jgi:hypothetical protein